MVNGKKKRKRLREELDGKYSDEQLVVILWILQGRLYGTTDEILEYSVDKILHACEEATGCAPEI